MAKFVDLDLIISEIAKAQVELETDDDTNWRINKPIYKGLCWARNIIESAPVVESSQVFDCGYWEEVQGKVYRCSKCHHAATVDINDNFVKTKRCLNCGAIMKEDG